MELMDCSLYDYLNQNDNITEFKKAFLFQEIVKGVLYCHQQGVIHFDIKLENVLLKLNEKGDIISVKLADFGGSRGIDEQLEAGKI